MDVQLICALPSWNRPETDYVRVLMSSVPGDDTIVLATIERVVDKDTSSPAERSELSRRVKTLISRRMSASDAFVLAKSYAERKGIAVVYADQG